MRLIAAVLLLCACGATERPFICRTVCGVEIESFPDKRWNCEGMQRIEDAILQEFPHADDPRMQDPCDRMHGYYVHVVPSERFEDSNYPNKPLAGVTDCQALEISVHNIPPWCGSAAYAHEMAHAVQNCKPNQCAHTGRDDSHWCWDTNNIEAAILAATAEVQ